MAPAIIKVVIGNDEVEVDIDSPSSRCRTYGDLKSLLLERRVISSDYVLVDEEDQPFDDGAPINVHNETVYAKSISYTVVVVDKGFRCELNVTNRARVGDVLQLSSTEIGQPVVDLSFGGQRLNAEAYLFDAGIGPTSRLVGRIGVIVRDSKCGFTQEVEAMDYWTVADLKSAYTEKSHRKLRAQCTLTRHGEIMQDDRTLFQCSVQHNHTLEFDNPAYEIEVVDQQPGMTVDPNETGIKITVFDHLMFEQVKDVFSKASRQVLVAADKLVFDGTVADDGVMLYTLGVTEGSRLLLHREDQTQAIEYDCGECGTLVLLKRSEPVRCRACGHRIIYKRRTARPCQYLAR